MTDPTRLLDSGTELEATLLGSARDDAPRRGLDRRVHAAIGIGGIAVGASTASTSAAAATKVGPVLASQVSVLLGVGKWVGALVLGTGIAVGAVTVVRHQDREETSAPSARVAPPLGRGVQAAEPALSNAPGVQAMPVVDVPPPPLPAADPVLPAPVPNAARSQSNAFSSRASSSQRTPKAPALQQEVALLDQAHSALESGDTASALAMLDRHDLEYVRGSLAPEALEVRIEAYALRHDDAKVSELGNAFLARYAGHPLAGKVRSLLAKSPSP
jgi:hypothetical protein